MVDDDKQIWIMMAFGILGYGMIKYKYSPAGVLLGIILGPIAETGLRDLMTVSNNAPISFIFSTENPKWISILIIFLIVVAVYYALKPKPWDDETKSAD